MHIVIINPPQGFATGRKPNIDDRLYLFPPGILSIASECEHAGHETEILDFPLLRWNLRKYEKWLDNSRPDVIGISCCSPSLPFVKSILKSTKLVSPNTSVIVGGPHPTFSPREFLQPQLADYVVRFEGNTIIPSLLSELENGKENIQTRGVSFRRGKTIINNDPMPFIADLDILGIPPYHLIDMQAYTQILNRVAVCTMRGCPFGCNFCTITRLMGPTLRLRSPEKVIEELKLVIERYGVNRFSFTDPNFTLFPERLEQLYRLIRRENIDIEFGCQSRLFTFTDGTLPLLKKMGCVAVFVGIESGSEKVLSYYGKTQEKRKRIDVMGNLKKIKDYGIDVIPSIILGSPDETLEDIEASLKLMSSIVETLELKTQKAGAGGNFQTNMFGPFPGVMTQSSLQLELPIEYAPSLPVCGTKYVSRNDVKSIWHRVWQEFYPGYYDKYLMIEAAAEKGKNILLDEFVKDTALDMAREEPARASRLQKGIKSNMSN